MNISDGKLYVFARRIMYIGLGCFDQITNRRNKLFIFCYHAIGGDKWKYGISKSEIEKQMRFLLKNHDAVELSKIEDHIRGINILTKPAFSVTFDDGYSDIVQLVDLFKELNVHPTVFVLGNSNKVDRLELDNERALLTQEEIEILKSQGWDIQSHGMTHAFLPRNHHLKDEINKSIESIYEKYHIFPKYFAYPKGGYDEDVIEAVKNSGYTMALSMDSGFINDRTNIYTVPRVGVDRTHSFVEFKYLFSPSVVNLRSMAKPVFELLEKIKK